MNLWDETSRVPAVLSDTKDYCKQHIILHYIAKALYPGTDVYAIGKVRRRRRWAKAAERNGCRAYPHGCRWNRRSSAHYVRTCIQYSDKAVCNVTSSNSASTLVTPENCQGISRRIPTIDAATIIMAAPEVSVDARIEFAERGGKKAGLSASLHSPAKKRRHLSRGWRRSLTDLLSLNEDEARGRSHRRTPENRRMSWQ